MSDEDDERRRRAEALLALIATGKLLPAEQQQVLQIIDADGTLTSGERLSLALITFRAYGR